MNPVEKFFEGINLPPNRGSVPPATRAETNGRHYQRTVDVYTRTLPP